MAIKGGCYCGSVRYEISADPAFKGQCHCRECQYISGGGPNVFMGVPKTGFQYTSGKPSSFTRDDLESPVTREFCDKCGTSLASLVPGMPDIIALKVGSLDDPDGDYGMPQMAIFLCDKRGFHTVPEGVATFDKTP